jgi:hypothetical protein
MGGDTWPCLQQHDGTQRNGMLNNSKQHCQYGHNTLLQCTVAAAHVYAYCQELQQSSYSPSTL